MSQRLRASKEAWLKTKAGQNNQKLIDEEMFKGLLPDKEIAAIRAQTQKEIAAYEHDQLLASTVLPSKYMEKPEFRCLVKPSPQIILFADGSRKELKELTFVVDGEPCRACRMTQRDKWRKPRRPAVQKYFDYRDRVRAAVSRQNKGEIPASPDGLHCIFYFAMPDSWSKKKKAAMVDRPHQQVPDRDNLEKAVMDALFDNDAGIWYGRTEKRWCPSGMERVTITMIYESETKTTAR